MMEICPICERLREGVMGSPEGCAPLSKAESNGAEHPMTYPERPTPRLLLFLLLAGLAACTPRPDSPPASSSSEPASRGEAAEVCAALQSSAAVPAIKPAGQAVRVLAFGDFGDGGDHQRAVAAAMARYDKDHPFDFGLTLGDNFYEHGLNKADHPR